MEVRGKHLDLHGYCDADIRRGVDYLRWYRAPPPEMPKWGTEPADEMTQEIKVTVTPISRVASSPLGRPVVGGSHRVRSWLCLRTETEEEALAMPMFTPASWIDEHTHAIDQAVRGLPHYRGYHKGRLLADIEEDCRDRL
jgi:hypothetical protein